MSGERHARKLTERGEIGWCCVFVLAALERHFIQYMWKVECVMCEMFRSLHQDNLPSHRTRLARGNKFITSLTVTLTASVRNMVITEREKLAQNWRSLKYSHLNTRSTTRRLSHRRAQNHMFSWTDETCHGRMLW